MSQIRYGAVIWETSGWAKMPVCLLEATQADLDAKLHVGREQIRINLQRTLSQKLKVQFVA